MAEAYEALAVIGRIANLVDRARAVAVVFRLAREERDAWVTWPARAAPCWTTWA